MNEQIAAHAPAVADCSRNENIALPCELDHNHRRITLRCPLLLLFQLLICLFWVDFKYGAQNLGAHLTCRIHVCLFYNYMKFNIFNVQLAP